MHIKTDQLKHDYSQDFVIQSKPSLTDVSQSFFVVLQSVVLLQADPVHPETQAIWNCVRAGKRTTHTHTSACTCTHTQFRHPPTYNNKDMYIHTCTHRHAQTRKSQTKSELLQRKDTSSFVIQLIFKTLTDNWKFAKTSKRNKISLWQQR